MSIIVELRRVIVNGSQSSCIVSHMMRGRPLDAFRRELPRKCLHLSSAVIPLLYLILSRPAMLIGLSVLVALAVIMEVGRRVYPRGNALLLDWCGALFREEERGATTAARPSPPPKPAAITGATWVVAGALLTVLLFPRNAAVAGLLVMSISDALAALVGRGIGGPAIGGKTLAGSAAFCISATLILWLAASVALPKALLIATALTLMEALTLRLGRMKLSDNLLIPLAAGAMLTLS